MQGDRSWVTTAWRAGALCVALAAGWPAPDAAAQGKPRGVKLAAAGAWTLALVKMNATASMCAASTQDGAANAIFDYVVINRDVTAFRVAGPAVQAAPDSDAAAYILQVDRRAAIAVSGRRTGGVALLPVDKDAPAKRQFVRDLAEGDKLEVRDLTGDLIGTFQLRGADKVLRAFGLCVARLPKFAPPR